MATTHAHSVPGPGLETAVFRRGSDTDEGGIDSTGAWHGRDHPWNQPEPERFDYLLRRPFTI